MRGAPIAQQHAPPRRTWRQVNRSVGEFPRAEHPEVVLTEQGVEHTAQQLRIRARRAVLLGLTIAAAALLSLSIPFRIMAQTYGNALFATLLLFVGLAIEHFRLKRAGRNVLSG